MRSFSMLSLTLGIALVTASCNEGKSGRSTSVDATNNEGRAPVEYNGGTDTPRTDRSMQTQPAEQKAVQDRNAEASISSPNNAAPLSNTTDSSTTSGSAKPKKK